MREWYRLPGEDEYGFWERARLNGYNAAKSLAAKTENDIREECAQIADLYAADKFKAVAAEYDDGYPDSCRILRAKGKTAEAIASAIRATKGTR